LDCLRKPHKPHDPKRQREQGRQRDTCKQAASILGEIQNAAGHDPEQHAPNLKLATTSKLALLGPEASRDSFQPKLSCDSWL